MRFRIVAIATAMVFLAGLLVSETLATPISATSLPVRETGSMLAFGVVLLALAFLARRRRRSQ